jgi:hypothetical protein
LLLCGDTAGWPAGELDAIRARHGALVTVHRLTREPEPGALVDPTGSALDRLGGDRTAAHYLVRPDGHIAHRNGGTELAGLIPYLDHWLPAV